jgi:osmotically-inducible protein OsmY
MANGAAGASRAAWKKRNEPMRTDLDLRHDVERELDWEPRIDASEIGVAVKEGIVTLTGLVSTYREKLAAEEAAKRVAGVLGLANDIEVHLKTDSKLTDAEIAHVAVEVLKANASVPAGRVRPVVKEGVVVLEGQVEWQYQRAAAQRCVETLHGVTGVINKIVMRPNAAAARTEVKQKIEEALRRAAQIDAERIKVETANGKITLRGKVRSYWERAEAEAAAWAAPGVREVENHLTIATPVYEE